MPRVIGAVPLFGCAFRLGLLVSVTVALGCDGTHLVPPSPPPPVAALVSPHIGSTSGGTTVSVTGSAFQVGAIVTLDGAPVGASLNGTGTELFFTTPAHAAGSVDVVVRNPDGQSVTLSGAYTFVAPEAFDVNGNWFAYLGDGNDDPFSFKVEGNALVSLTCYEGTPVTLPSPLPINDGEVAASVNGIVIFSAFLVGPDSAVGTINAGLCHSQEWYGWKDQQGTARLSSAVLGPSRRHK
jgi:hypothetical protein